MLKNDKRAIFTGAAHAQRAADYLQNLQDALNVTGFRRLMAAEFGRAFPNRKRENENS